MTQKFVMGCPLYRQEQEISRQGIQLSRQTMSNWILRATEDYLVPVYQRLHEELLKREVLHADETTLQVLHEPGKKPESESFMWLYRTSGDTEENDPMLELSAYPISGQLRVYDIEAISLPIVYNKFGDLDPNGMLYVLKQDSERIQREARKRFELPVPQPYEEVRPLVIRANVGDTVQINFENKQNRRASIHVQGLSYNVLTSDGTDVRYNPDFTTGRCICYTWQADQEGVFLFAHNGIRLLDKDGNLIKTTEQGMEAGDEGGHDAPDHEDTGEKGFNYRSERFFNRLQRLPIISKVFDSKVHGDPATPVFRSYPGERVIIRLLMPADKPRNISFALHGHRWRAQPDDPFTRIIPALGCGVRDVGHLPGVEPEHPVLL